jgi:argininosuccinate lyase
VLPPPWPNFLWMFVCIWVKFWFHHFTSASNTGSSIMPRKTRCFELIRGKCNKIQLLHTKSL